jgi:hypothetical protein
MRKSDVDLFWLLSPVIVSILAALWCLLVRGRPF